MKKAIKILHTSDTHLGDPYAHSASEESLKNVLEAVESTNSNFLLIVGDVFDNERVSNDSVIFFLNQISQTAVPVIILPGNHDLMHSNSIYKRPIFQNIPKNLYIFKNPTGEEIQFKNLGISFWGKAMDEHSPKFKPLTNISFETNKYWKIALAHGQFEEEGVNSGRSSLISPQNIIESGCDYVALGHWDSFADVSQNDIPAYYSGCPIKLSKQTTGMVSLINLDPSLGVSHTRHALNS